MSVTITGLYCYPIKSCRGVSLTEATIGIQGFLYDRRWMLVEAETGRFLTQREYPAMACIAPNVTDDGLTVSVADKTTLIIPLRSDTDLERRTVTVWRFTGEALDEGNDAADWFTDVMGFPCRLVRTPDDFSRRVNPEYGNLDDRMSFADGYPVLLANVASLDNLNDRIVENGGEPVPMERFRPNIVMRGAGAFAEDDWKYLVTENDGATFRAVKPCDRCAVTTIDQTTGEKTGAEPLATLAHFRRDTNGKVNFAINLIPDRESIGKRVRISETLRIGLVEDSRLTRSRI